MGENVKVKSVMASQLTTLPTTGPMNDALLKGP